MNRNAAIHIRPATVDDESFILGLIPRLVEFGPPPWRDIPGMVETDRQFLSEKMAQPSPDTPIFIAEDETGLRLGFIQLQIGTDYYNHARHGHIGNVIVAPEGEGHGIGRLLIEKAEEWARAQGFRWLTLSVFAQNLRARAVYQRLGFGEDILKYVKELT